MGLAQHRSECREYGILRYNSSGNLRWVEFVTEDQVAKHTDTASLPAAFRRTGSVYLLQGRVGSFQRAWDQPLFENGVPTRTQPQRHQAISQLAGNESRKLGRQIGLLLGSGHWDLAET